MQKAMRLAIRSLTEIVKGVPPTAGGESLQKENTRMGHLGVHHAHGIPLPGTITMTYVFVRGGELWMTQIMWCITWYGKHGQWSRSLVGGGAAWCSLELGIGRQLGKEVWQDCLLPRRGTAARSP